MPVTLQIDDGPANATWLSPAILAGQLSASGSFTTLPLQQNVQTLTRNTQFDFRIQVRNSGNQDTMGPAGTGPTGAFTAPPAQSGNLVNTGQQITAPGGQTTLRIEANVGGGFDQAILRDAAGSDFNLGGPLAQTRNLGYSPNGRYVIVHEQRPSGMSIAYFAAQAMGTGSQRQVPGQLVYTAYPAPQSAGGGVPSLASVGKAFVPGSDVALLNHTTVSGTRLITVDLRPSVIQREASYDTATRQAARVLVSPAGDLLALIGSPAQFGNPADPIELLTLSSLASVLWRRRGMAAPQLLSDTNTSLRLVKPRGWEAVEVTSGTSVVLIDSPTPNLAAVQVTLWIGSSATGFTAGTIPTYPIGQTPSAVIDRIAAGRAEFALVDANWRAVPPPPGEHYCAVAEAFSVPGSVQGDPQMRTTPALDITLRQIAQRNLVVI